MELVFLYLLLLVSCFIYWCINEKTGLQLCIVALFSIWIISVYQQLDIKLPINIDISWFIFAVIFCGYLFLRRQIEAFVFLSVRKFGFRAYMIVTAVTAFIMILYRPNYEFVLPGGFLLGLGAGYYLNKRYVGFYSSGVLQRKGIAKYLTLFARFLFGFVVLLLIEYKVVKIMQSVSENQNVMLYGFLCYAVISLWVFVIAPWVFIKIRLADKNKDDSLVEQPAE
jgi:hypothetical protein